MLILWQFHKVIEFWRAFFLGSQFLPFSPSRPVLHLCGHIHESHGILEEEGGTTTVNAAALDLDGKLAWQPVVLGGQTINYIDPS